MNIIQKIAQNRFVSIQKNRRTKRFKNVLGRLIHAHLIQAHDNIEPHNNPLSLADYLWAGQFEKRLYELLPALILKKPSFFRNLKEIPKDLQEILNKIKKRKDLDNFRGIAPKDYMKWIPLIGHKGIKPTLLKSFRLHEEEIDRLRRLTKHGYTEVEALREGLQLLEEKLTRSCNVNDSNRQM